MTAVTEHAGPYVEAFPKLASTGHDWLDALRESAMREFSARGFPTTREEEWRFTNVAPIARVPFERAHAADLTPESLETLLFSMPGATRLVFVNGRFAPRLSSVAEGVKAGSLAEALRTDPDAVRTHLAQHASVAANAFVALNTAFIEDGAWVRVTRGTVVEQPVYLVYVSVAGAAPAVTHPRTLVTVGPNAQLSLAEVYVGLGEQVYFTNAVTEIAAGESAVVDHYKLQLERTSAFHVATMQVKLGRSANFSSHSISLGGALVRNDANAVLDEGCEATLNGLYLVNGTQHVDNHTAIDHAQPHAASHELYKGILDGHSSAVFNGKIYVRKDAQKTDAKQTNKNLVLSEDAVINTKPELQIWADDVRCTHGATIGQLDAEAVFYLQSRGIGREEARDLLTHAFARDVIDRIKVEPLRDRLERVLFERLHEYGH
ncbi:MAG TPA: Fe-S cluster assembly protein SufD [Bryobacteraceae bacterium]|nr:Fe-S cluster assembly protein SufD [Bryobacteraceae bacterium]